MNKTIARIASTAIFSFIGVLAAFAASSGLIGGEHLAMAILSPLVGAVFGFVVACVAES